MVLCSGLDPLCLVERDVAVADVALVAVANVVPAKALTAYFALGSALRTCSGSDLARGPKLKARRKYNIDIRVLCSTSM